MAVNVSIFDQTTGRSKSISFDFMADLINNYNGKIRQ